MKEFFDIYDTDVMERADTTEDIFEEPKEEEPAFETAFEEDNPDLPAGNYFVYYGITPHASFTMDEVKEVMARYRAGLDAEDCEMAKQASKEMFEMLYSFIIWFLGKKYSTYMVKYKEDLLSASYLGFCKGMKTYDPEQGYPSTWFKRFILHECDAFINSQISHTSAHYASAKKKIDECVEKKNAAGASYTDRDICIEAGVSYRTISRVQAISGTKYVSMSSAEKDLDVPTEFGNPEDNAIHSEKAQLLYKTIEDILDDKEKTVMIYKCGLAGYPQYTADEIEEYFGIKSSEVARIYKNASAKLARAMKPRQKKEPKKKETAPQITIGEMIFGENYMARFGEIEAVQEAIDNME